MKNRRIKFYIRNWKYCFSCCFLLGLAISVQAADSLNTKPRSYYITNHTDKINVTPFLYFASNRFVFSAQKKSVQFTPNEAPSIGLKLQHKWLGFGITYGPKNIQDNEKGSSTYFNIVLNSYGKKQGFDMYYLSNKGYYIGNKKVNEDLKTTVPYVLRPDLETKGIGFNVYYIFNHNRFSYRSSFIQNEIQNKSAGSFLLTLSGSYYAIKADSSVVPNIYQSEIILASQIRTGMFYSAGLLPGYSFTLVGWKRLFFTLSFSYGLVYQIQQYEAEASNMEESVNRNLWISRGLARFSTGFNSTYFYCGISGMGDNYHIPLGSGNQLQYSIGSLQLFVGTRLSFPKKFAVISKSMDKVPLISEKPDK